jgi:hypothetical protein
MNMLVKDRNYFKKNQARKNKNDEAAASNKADAEADDDSENPTDDDEPGQNSRDDSPKTVPIKKSAPKKRVTTKRKLATGRSASPTIQGAVITKAVQANPPADGGRRLHREVDFGYYSAPSDSEHTEARKLTLKKDRKALTMVKLKETIDRHARYCPFVQINKKLHHAHRRIRKLQGRPTNEPELWIYRDGNYTFSRHRGKGSAIEVGSSNGNDSAQKAESEDEDEDEDLAEHPGVIAEDKSTVSRIGCLARRNAPAVRKAKKEYKKLVPYEESSPSGEDDTGNATAGATDKDAPTSKATDPKHEASTKTLQAQSSLPVGDIALPDENDVDRQEDAHDAPLTTPEDHEIKQSVRPEHAVQQPSVKPATTTTKADADKKRKASDSDLSSEAEPTSKNRKTLAN